MISSESSTPMDRWAVSILVLALLLLTGFWLSGSNSTTDRKPTMVVYCAHDQVYAESILNDFQKRTGIRVDVRYDTEATKSLGLINLIVTEREQPCCDVFWNNELLGMVDLQARGLLEPYQGTGWNRVPEKYRDPDGHWVGFGARLRVHIVNADRMPSTEEAVRAAFALEPTSTAVAKPLFGTTLTHYTVLWSVWGPDRLKKWHHDLRLRGARETDGNAAVKDLVASGVCGTGLTDTDDFFVAKDAGKPVEMLPVRLNAMIVRKADANLEFAGEYQVPGRTICIPNTAAIIRGTKRLEAAQKLIDFLASAETELALARSSSRQIPLGPVDESQLSDDVRQLKEWAADGVDLRPLLPARRDCLEWLKAEYLR